MSTETIDALTVLFYKINGLVETYDGDGNYLSNTGEETEADMAYAKADGLRIARDIIYKEITALKDYVC